MRSGLPDRWNGCGGGGSQKSLWSLVTLYNLLDTDTPCPPKPHSSLGLVRLLPGLRV